MIIKDTNRRPDLILYADSIKTAIWVELTSPWEDNMEAKHFEKLGRYNKLALDAKANGWRVIPICVEVGCRGRIFPPGWKDMIRTLGFTTAEEKQLKAIVEQTATHCSHAIFALHKQPWSSPKPLLDVTSWHQNWSL